MFDYRSMFHTGFLVRDLPRAMEIYADSLGLRWAQPYTYKALGLWTPERGAETIRLDVVYSIDGPQHVEMQTGPAGTFYDPDRHSGHHAGFWVQSVRSAIEELVSRNWTVAACGASPADGYGGFAYLRPPCEGLMIEVASVAAKPRFENWWNGAPGPVVGPAGE